MKPTLIAIAGLVAIILAGLWINRRDRVTNKEDR